MLKIAVYPGSFDPITYGHLDILKRSCGLFDKVIVAIGKNTSKVSVFNEEERINLINNAISMLLPNLQQQIIVEAFSSLLVNYVAQKNAKAIIRGIRTLSDFEFEFNLAGLNAKLNNNIETIFLLASEDKQFISSRFVVDIAKFGGDVSQFVPNNVKLALFNKFN